MFEYRTADVEARRQLFCYVCCQMVEHRAVRSQETGRKGWKHEECESVRMERDE